MGHVMRLASSDAHYYRNDYEHCMEPKPRYMVDVGMGKHSGDVSIDHSKPINDLHAWRQRHEQ